GVRQAVPACRGEPWGSLRAVAEADLVERRGEDGIMHHKLHIVAAAALVALLGSTTYAADEKADATVEFSAGSVPLAVRYSWGDGTLSFRGGSYPFTIKGLSIVDIGASSIEASGSVYHLNNIQDFEGNFTAISAGATIAGGGSATAMQNQHGVVMHVTSTT